MDVFSGADGHLITSLFSSDGGEFGFSVASLGDVDGNGFPELIVGSPQERDPQTNLVVGGARVFEFRPGLYVRPATLSVSGTTPAEALIEFPTTEAARNYALLASASGYGPTVLGGFEVPLTMDPLLSRMSGGWFPAFLQNGRGLLNLQGDARALIHPDPALAPHIGRTIWLSAVVWDVALGTVRMASVARPLEIVP
ncbi:MAG: hypothetical protein D6702_01270 [Planctomycetota bacterium]|nr:MAG: hypothetical protein D6702_01270 [Planctomycetota bacterium]